MATSHIHIRPPGIEALRWFAFVVREVMAVWMAFLTFNPSSSTYAEYLLTYVGPFGAGETA